MSLRRFCVTGKNQTRWVPVDPGSAAPDLCRRVVVNGRLKKVLELLAGVGFRRWAGIAAALALASVPGASADTGSAEGWEKRTHLTGDRASRGDRVVAAALTTTEQAAAKLAPFRWNPFQWAFSCLSPEEQAEFIALVAVALLLLAGQQRAGPEQQRVEEIRPLPSENV